MFANCCRLDSETRQCATTQVDNHTMSARDQRAAALSKRQQLQQQHGLHPKSHPDTDISSSPHVPGSQQQPVNSNDQDDRELHKNRAYTSRPGVSPTSAGPLLARPQAGIAFGTADLHSTQPTQSYAQGRQLIPPSPTSPPSSASINMRLDPLGSNTASCNAALRGHLLFRVPHDRQQKPHISSSPNTKDQLQEKHAYSQTRLHDSRYRTDDLQFDGLRLDDKTNHPQCGDAWG